MPKKFIRRYIPTPERIAALPGIHRLGSRITDPNLWHINRRSIAGAMFWGIVCAWIPLPSQMLIAAACAILFRVNLPLSIALTWISNPFTMLPILYSSYCIGSLIFGVPMLDITQIKHIIIQLTTSLFGDSASAVPTQYHFNLGALLVGLLIEAVVLGAIGNILVKLLWRWHVVRDLRERQIQRKQYRQDQGKS
ncbi:DUF2062 domain-containing protein [Aquirhabdus sp.]|uniref:DUF2062 domain-containing protein n=1 Tax=Aquirhabdus sp. TaxID=2824160 RepID=UPI00396CC107